MDLKTYRDKVKACWLGKNVGGTLGAPFEGRRGVLDIDYYTHDLSEGVLPNDDLDLQLVFLNAAERYGKTLTADILAEYWLTYIVADWSEYGMGKNNLRIGLPIGIAGRYENKHKDSCGCFIRSEIWACLAPGRPDIAVKFALEDAMIDHADDGMYGEIFCAALQSAAFVEHDIRKLIDIALSYIPKDCGIAKGIETAIACYDNGLDWKAARKEILQAVPGSFGLIWRAFGMTEEEGYPSPKDGEIPEGEIGYDAPSNVALMAMSLLYGEGDFSKTVCIAAGCCEDADCTAGTAGAVVGIIGGTGCIDEKWLVPIGDEIKTISIDATKEGNFFSTPKKVSEITERVVRLMPVFMHGYYNPDEGTFETSEMLYDSEKIKGVFDRESFNGYAKKRNNGIRKINTLMEVIVDVGNDITISNDEKKTMKLSIDNLLRLQQWLDIQMILPEEWEGIEHIQMPLNQIHGVTMMNECEISFVPHNLKKGRYDIPLIISSFGRLEKMYIPLVFIVK